jgi:hypothetical protein
MSVKAGLLTSGSSSTLRLPDKVSVAVRSAHLQRPSPVTAAGPFPIFTGFPYYGCLEKLGFWFKVKARMEILPPAYQRYCGDKMFMRNAEFGQKDNFSGWPYVVSTP